MRAFEWVWFLFWPFAFGWALATADIWRKRYLRLRKVWEAHAQVPHIQIAIQQESWDTEVKPPKDFRN